MKRKSWRYTEHAIEDRPTNGLGWLKFVLACVVISPLRLVNEVSRKLLFLGTGVVRRVCLYALAMNGGFVLWSLFWNEAVKPAKPFLPMPVMLVSAGLIALAYAWLGRVQDFDYEILPTDAEDEEEERKFIADLEEIKVFDQMTAANVSFEDSINIFIRDPDELDVMGISPAVYDEGEDKRLLNGIEKKAAETGTAEIKIPTDSFADLDFAAVCTSMSASYNLLTSGEGTIEVKI